MVQDGSLAIAGKIVDDVAYTIGLRAHKHQWKMYLQGAVKSSPLRVYVSFCQKAKAASCNILHSNYVSRWS